MKKIFSLLAFIALAFSSSAQDFAYSAIPEGLKENADAIVRYDNYNFIIKSKEEVETQRSWAITILNDDGAKEHGTFRIQYSKLSKIKDISCTLYDANGKKLKSLKRADIQDIGMGFQDDYITDIRMKVASFDDQKYDYPYTVAFEYMEESKNPMFYPFWYPILAERTSVFTSTFTVENPLNIPFRFKETSYNGKAESEVMIANGSKTWTVSNLKAFENEPFTDDDNQIGIILAPKEFELDGQEGNLESWQAASEFYYKFNMGRDELPELTKKKLADLIKPGDDVRTKTKKVYEYMQSHTRYMSIQLGVGGWQTIPAMEVATKGYGDCKALTNYTVAMLEHVGVPACAALIRAGANTRFSYTDFSRMSFNHVIACVPTPTDTLWLECTSQDNPFNYLGSFTGNRHALLIKPKGGELVKTPTYYPELNFQKRSSLVKLADDGSANIEMKTSYGGIQQDRKTYFYRSLSTEEIKNRILKEINLPNFKLASYDFEIVNEELPILNETLQIESRKLASKSGKRMFLNLNPVTSFVGTPKKPESRLTSIYLNPNTYNFEDTDTTIFELPKNIEIEYLPKSETVESVFGTYINDFKREGDKLIYTRKVKMNGGKYNAEQYQELYDFVKAVNKLDKVRAVFVVGET